jgi:hypothetical protein
MASTLGQRSVCTAISRFPIVSISGTLELGPCTVTHISGGSETSHLQSQETAENAKTWLETYYISVPTLFQKPEQVWNALQPTWGCSVMGNHSE